MNKQTNKQTSPHSHLQNKNKKPNQKKTREKSVSQTGDFKTFYIVHNPVYNPVQFTQGSRGSPDNVMELSITRNSFYIAMLEIF